jgi:hypothetical protein
MSSDRFNLTLETKKKTFAENEKNRVSRTKYFPFLKIEVKVSQSLKFLFCLCFARNSIFKSTSSNGDATGPTLTFFSFVYLIHSQALESTKSILNEDFLTSIDSHLSKEVKLLQQQWITPECQENFKKHANTGEW